MSNLAQFAQDRLVESVQAAAFGRGQTVGKREGRKLLKGGLEAMQVGLELLGLGRDGGLGRFAMVLEAVAQQSLAVRLVGDLIRLDEPERLARRQAGVVDGGQAGGLIPV